MTLASISQSWADVESFTRSLLCFEPIKTLIQYHNRRIVYSKMVNFMVCEFCVCGIRHLSFKNDRQALGMENCWLLMPLYTEFLWWPQFSKLVFQLKTNKNLSFICIPLNPTLPPNLMLTLLYFCWWVAPWFLWGVVCLCSGSIHLALSGQFVPDSRKLSGGQPWCLGTPPHGLSPPVVSSPLGPLHGLLSPAGDLGFSHGGWLPQKLE